MQTVLLTGITSCESRGVEALVRSLTEQLQSRPGTRIVVLTQTPDLDAAALADTEALCVADPFVVSRSWAQLRPAETTTKLARRCEQLIGSASLVVATGGDLHTPDYGVSTPYLRALTAAQRHGTPTALIGQSVGPFADPEEAAAFTTVAAASDVLTVREAVSHRYLTQQLRLPEQHVKLSADPAFLLTPAGRARAEAILGNTGLDPRQPYVCLAPSQGITSYSSLTPGEHLLALRLLVRRLWDVRKVPVVLVPHCHDSRQHNDDRILARQIAAEVADALPVHVLEGDHNAAEYKAVLGGAELVVSERLHASIAALSSGTPAVAIGHSHKFHGVLAQVCGDVRDRPVHFDVAKFAADPADIDRIAGLDTETLRGRLTHRLPRIVDLAAGDIRLLHSLLDL